MTLANAMILVDQTAVPLALPDILEDFGAVTDSRWEGSEIIVTATVGGDGFNGPSHFGFRLSGERVERMTIRA